MVDYPLPLREGKIKPYSNGRPRIDWTHPLTKGLEFYCPFGNPGFEVDLVSGKKAFYTAHDVRAVTPWGLAHSNNNPLASSSKTVMCFPAGTGTKTSDGAGGGDFTVACACFIPSTLSGVFGPDLFGQFDPTNGIGIWFTTNTGTAQPNGFDPSGNLPSSGPNCYQQYSTIAISRKATSSFGFLNGVQWTTGTMNGTGCWSSATGVYLDIAVDPSNPTATSSSLQSQVFWGGMWNRALSQAEHNLLSTDPYCFLIWPEDELFASYTVPSPSIVPTFQISGVDYQLPRDPLAWPGAITPLGAWFDPSHPASHNCQHSAVATRGTIINLLTPKTNVTYPFSMPKYGVGTVGPYATDSGSSDSAINFDGIKTVVQNQMTWAGVINMSSLSNQRLFQTQINHGWEVDQGGASVGFVLACNGGNFAAVNTGSISAGVPYFVAMSADTTQNIYSWVQVNLNTGQIQSGSGTTTFVLDTGTLPTCSWGVDFTGGMVGAQMSAAMFANNYMSLGQLLAWAQDPWAFWYPRTQDDLFTTFALTPAPSIVPSIPGLLQTRSGPGLGPRSRHVRLLNAPLPVAGAAPIVTGGTLPILGVG